MVHKTVRHFEETGSVKNCPKTGRPATATNLKKSLIFCNSLWRIHIFPPAEQLKNIK